MRADLRGSVTEHLSLSLAQKPGKMHEEISSFLFWTQVFFNSYSLDPHILYLPLSFSASSPVTFSPTPPQTLDAIAPLNLSLAQSPPSPPLPLLNLVSALGLQHMVLTKIVVSLRLDEGCKNSWHEMGCSGRFHYCLPVPIFERVPPIQPLPTDRRAGGW